MVNLLTSNIQFTPLVGTVFAVVCLVVNKMPKKSYRRSFVKFGECVNYTGWVKSKLLILSEHVNKTEKIGGM